MNLPAALLTCTLACLAGAAKAQSTNYANTSAERNAAREARTAADAAKAARGTGNSSSSSSSYSSPNTSSGSYNPLEFQIQQERQAAKQRAANQAAEERAADARYAPERAARRRQEEKNAAFMMRQQGFERTRSTLMLPLMRAGFSQGDARLMAYQLDGVSETDPDILPFLDQVRQAQQAYETAFDQPNATFETLRELARQLPRGRADRVMRRRTILFGLGTAAEHRLELWERFPANRPVAAADLLQAAESYLVWDRAFERDFDTPAFRQRLTRGMLAAAPALPDQAAQMGARLASTLMAWSGAFEADIYRRELSCDTAVAVPLLRFCYAGTMRCLRDEGLSPNLSKAQLQVNAQALTARLSHILWLQGNWEPARQWTLRALDANPRPIEMLLLLAEHPSLAPAMQPAEWNHLAQALKLTEPLPTAALTTWLADPIAYYDHPRWQTLTPAQRTSLAQARNTLLQLLPRGFTWGEGSAREKMLPQGIPQGPGHLREKLATWTMVLFPADSPEAADALTLWEQAAQLGSVVGARNAYRAYLLRDRAPKVQSHMVQRPLNLFRNFRGLTAEQKYLGALVLLDELPGYPRLGKANKKEGLAWLEAAKAAGSTAAAARLAR